ncbi:MAG TPA: dephospho-CoA kinase [Candidatus Limnocylindria bacterium]
MKVIGLTGNIGCGKSTVAALLRERGVATIDADEVARDVRRPGSPESARILDRFGTLDPRQLARLVFEEPVALADLEAIIHPRVRELVGARLAELEQEGAVVAAVEAIKLLESPLRERCDQVWVVVCRPEDALRRLAQRGLSEADVQDRLASQMAAADLVRAADVVIDGSADIGETARQVEVALAGLADRGTSGRL